MRFKTLGRIVLTVLTVPTVPTVLAQGPAAAPPTNALPNPYQTVTGWARMPEGRTWGSTSAVEIDKDGVSIWVAERCGANSCAGSDLDPILKFDSTGAMVKSFGAGMLLSPHGIFVDREGNVWVTDCACTGTAEQRQTPGKGHQVFKFSPDGTLVLSLGKAGGGREAEHFWQPNDVLVAPDGSIFVAEGHSDAATANASSPSPTPWPWTPKAACSSVTAATTESRSSTRRARSSPNGTSSADRAG